MRRVMVVAAAAAVMVVTMGAKGCGSTSSSSSSSGTAGAPAASATTAAAPTAPPTTQSKVITLKVTGDGPASVTVLDGSNENQHNGVAIPWSTTIADSPPDVGLEAQTSDQSTDASITCEIDIPGRPPVTNTSTGTDAVVNCTATPGL